jgi:ATP-dependent DNA ligase
MSGCRSHWLESGGPLPSSPRLAIFRAWSGVLTAGRRSGHASSSPCIPNRVSKPPAGPQRIHEIKHDGYRLIARKRDGRVRLFTRRGFDWTERYPRISAAVAALRPATVRIDGEAVDCDDAGP